MALTSSIAHADAVAVFLASKPQCGLSPDVYTAAKATAVEPWPAAPTHVPCPQLAYRQTPDQLTPDPREKAVEAVLTAAGDYDDLGLAVTVIGALRPDMERGDVLDRIHHLYELSDEVHRAGMRGDRVVEEHLACRYEDALYDLARQPVTR